VLRAAPWQILLFLLTVITAFDRIGRGAENVVVTSWWRDREENEALDGQELSGHLMAIAMDFSGPDEELELLRLASASLGMGALLEPDHLHVQLTPAPVLERTGTFFAARTLGLVRV
jgi:uncharacterized protein YcbK (DUF882 family)